MINTPKESDLKTLKARAALSYQTSTEVYFQSFTALSREEIKLVYHWRNHPEIRKWMFTKTSITFKNHLQFISNLSQKERNFYWIVKNQKNNLGVISLTIEKDLSINWGFYLNPDLFGSGYAVDLIHHALFFFFDTLYIKELSGFVNAQNINSILLHHLFGINHSSYIYRQNNKQKEWYSLRKISKVQWRKQNNSVKKQKKRIIENKTEIQIYKKAVLVDLKHLQKNTIII